MRAIILTIGVLSASAHAGTVQFLQQGRALGAAGPVEGDNDLVVRIYGAETGGTPLWEETYASVPFTSGYYAVTLAGDDDHGVALDSVFTGGDRWLTTEIDGVELSPRQAMHLVPQAAVAQAVPLVDQTQPCTVTGGIGFDTTTGGVVVCDGSTWGAIGQPGCPAGTAAMGPVCIDTAVRATEPWHVANDRCRDLGRRLCTTTELTYACENRASLGVSFPENRWIFTDQKDYKEWGGTYYMAHFVFRMFGGSCVDNNSTANPSNGKVSWSHGSSNYDTLCCLDR